MCEHLGRQSTHMRLEFAASALTFCLHSVQLMMAHIPLLLHPVLWMHPDDLMIDYLIPRPHLIAHIAQVIVATVTPMCFDGAPRHLSRALRSNLICRCEET